MARFQILFSSPNLRGGVQQLLAASEAQLSTALEQVSLVDNPAASAETAKDATAAHERAMVSHVLLLGELGRGYASEKAELLSKLQAARPVNTKSKPDGARFSPKCAELCNIQRSSNGVS